MDAFASPSIRAKTRAYSPASLGELFAATVVMGLALIAIPLPPNVQLDSSWQVMLIHAHAAGLQFGREVIFTWGPWGFLCSRFELGATCAVPIAAWAIGGSFLLAGILATLTRAEPPLRRLGLTLTVIAVHWLFQDAIYFAVIVVIGLRGLMNPRSTAWVLAAEVGFLGFLAEFKFTYFVLALATVLAAGAAAFRKRGMRLAVALVGGFGASVIALWVGAGQSLDNIVPYLRRSLEIASGYGAAMQYEESWRIFVAGLVTVLGALTFCWRWARRGADRTAAPWAAAVLAFSILLMWKEAYTRADMVPLGGHVLGLFAYLLIVLPSLGAAAVYLDRPVRATVVYFLAWAGLACVDPAYFRLAPEMLRERFYGAVQGIRRIGHLSDDWERDYRAAAAQAALPKIKEAVGAGTTDAYSFSTATLLMNNLALSTRPIFQSYSAYTPGLEGWNLRYYQSSRAPEFLIWNEDLVDHRYPGEDDAMLIGALPGHYVPVLTEGPAALFRRLSPLDSLPPRHRFLFERTVRIGEEVALPSFGGHPLWLELDAIPNLLGRLRGLLYKPATLQLVTTDFLGNQDRWRVVPNVARVGFVLVPTLQHFDDVSAYLEGTTDNPLRAFHLETPPTEDEFWDHFHLKILEVTDQPLRQVPTKRPVALGIFDRSASTLESQEQLLVIDVPEGKALLLHAPGAASFPVGAGTRRLSFLFGLRPGAYTEGGQTAGVDFLVEQTSAAGESRIVWRRRLEPVAVAADRGTQAATIDLSVPTAATVTLRTRAVSGPDNRWAWSYVTRVRFVGGPAP